MISSGEKVQTQYKGVRGWLLFFCLSLTIFVPLFTLYNIISAYNEISSQFYQLPNLLNLVIIAGLSTFSIYVGIKVWRVKPGAVRIAKNYLLLYLGYMVLGILFLLFDSLQAGVDKAIIGELARVVIPSFTNFALWYSYLSKSKRVKATFSAVESNLEITAPNTNIYTKLFISCSIIFIFLIIKGLPLLIKEQDDFNALMTKIEKKVEAKKDDEVIRLLDKARKLANQKFGSDNLSLATSLNDLANFYKRIGKHAEAEALYKRSLEIYEKSLGPDHLYLAIGLNNLAQLYYSIGEYTRADPLQRRSLQISEKVLGPEHPDLGIHLYNVAQLYRSFGDYNKAEVLLRRSLEIREKAYGPEHPDVAICLNALGELYRSVGDYAQAEALLTRSLEIFTKTLGPEHPSVALSLTSLSNLYGNIGDYGKQTNLLIKSLEIYEKALGPECGHVALNLDNLGSLYVSLRDYAKGERLLRRSLELCEKAFGPDHPYVIRSLNHLGNLYTRLGDYPEAEAFYKRALEICEKSLGPDHDHPRVAWVLNNMANLHLDSGDYVKAGPLYKRSLEILEKTLGPEHLQVATVHENMGYYLVGLTKYDEAFHSLTKAQSIEQKTIDNVMRFTSDKQKLVYLAQSKLNFNLILSLLAKHLSDDRESIREGFNTLLRRKGIVLDFQIRSSEALFLAEDPHTVKTFAELNKIRRRIASLIFPGPENQNPSVYTMRMKKLREQEEKIEAKLSRLSQRFALIKKAAKADIHQVVKILPKGSALIEFARPYFFNFHANGAEEKWGQAHYIAFILFAGKEEPRLIDLGEAQKIDDAIIEFRKECQEGGNMNKRRWTKASLEEKASALYDLVFNPLRENLNGHRRLFVSPEGSLNLIPFEALLQTNGRYLIEDYTISYITAGRDLLRFGQEKTQKGEALIIAAPDFDLNSKDKVKELKRQGMLEKPPSEERLLAKRSAEIGSLNFPPLPGTEREGEAISRILKDDLTLKTVLYTRQAALEEVLKGIKRPKVLHIATHGFFLRDEEIQPSDEVFRNPMLLSGQRAIPPGTFQAIEDPLLRSGLALAGANESLRNESREGDSEDGILTAAEVCGLNLQGTDLVVLSACETGIGEIQIGEGVFGLRRAFIQAGAQTLVTSLWRVSDESTVNLMEDFYKNLKTMDKAEALRQAQLKLMKSGTKKVSQRGVSGISKAEGKGQPLDTSHPYFWAPFILIGDWK